jgi:RNA polymerase sigma-70 factor (ECF subfamily)
MNMEEIISTYGKYIYNYALKLTCHPMDAEDIAQETFLKAWLKKEQLKNEMALRKWLQIICYNEFLMKMRQKENKNHLPVPDIEALEVEGDLLIQTIPGPEDEVLVEEEIKELQNGCFLAMVRKLTLNQRIAFSLIDMFGMKINEVADLLEISVPAAKGLLYRARMSIDSFFADHCNHINTDNPCSCKAWIRFYNNREMMQQKTKKLVQTLDYREKGYIFNETVRKRVQNLYLNMPERQPSKEWYDRVINSLK